MVSKPLLTALFLLACCATAEDWPSVNGPNHDNTASSTGLAATWPATGPKVVWEAKVVGGGAEQFASPIVSSGKVFVMSREYKKDPTGKKVVESTPDLLFCLDAKDGKELWKQEFQPQTPYVGELGHEHKSCWNTPIADGDMLYARGPSGELRAITINDGKTAWTSPCPAGGYAVSSPCVVVGDILIVPSGGGKANVVGLDKKTGEKKWEMPTYPCWQFSAGCMIPMDLGNGKTVVVASSFVFDPKTGKNLMPMTKDEKGRDVRATLPVCLNWTATFKGNKLISGYEYNAVKEKVEGKDVVKTPEGSGVGCVELSMNDDGTVSSKLLWKTEQTGNNRKWRKTYGGPVIQGECVYAFLGMHEMAGIMCVNIADGKVLWTEEKPKHGWGFSNQIGADSKILYHQGGQLSMIAADPAGYKEIASAKISAANWSTPALVGTRLFIRDDAGTVKCLELN